jgi:hypothetical protein
VKALKTWVTALLAGAAGCVHSGPAVHGPEDAARSYARALDEGRLEDAWSLSTHADHQAFLHRYSDAAVRHQRAQQLLEAADGRPTTSLALEGTPAGWRVAEPSAAVAPLEDEQQARALVDHFLTAVSSGDFEAVFGDLCASWRARYTPQRLKADLSSEPAALERLQRIRAALPGKWELTGDGPELVLGEGRRLKLQREGGALKVVALE